MKTFECFFCKEQFKSSYFKKYCCKDCRTRGYRATLEDKGNPQRKMINVDCDGCGKAIQIQPHRLKMKHHFCNRECFVAHQKMTLAPKKTKTEIKICSNCGSDICRRPFEFESTSRNHFCNRDCYYEYSRKQKEITRNKVECYVCKKTFNLASKYANDRKRPCCSRACAAKMRSLVYRGPQHPLWNDSVTDEDRLTNRSFAEYLDWRRFVFERDAFACKCCGDDRGGNLVAHHILNYGEHISLRTDVTNGITLCKICHKNFHDTFGYTKNTRQQINVFIKDHSKGP